MEDCIEEYKRNLLFIWITMFGILMIMIGVYAYAIGELREMDTKLDFMLREMDCLFMEEKRP